MKDKQRKLILTASILLTAAFAAFLLLQSGLFRKSPEVQVQPYNCFEETLVVISDADYRPYSFTDENGNPSGHDVELVNIIANELHMNLELKLMDWYEAIDAMNAGEGDVLMTCDYSDTFEGLGGLIKCVPVSFDDFIVYSKTDIRSSDELYGRRIAIMKNGNVTALIEMMNLGQYCTGYADNRSAMQALANGDADYAIMRQTVGTVLQQELGDAKIKGRIGIGQSYMCFDVAEDNPELAERINKALEKQKMNGEMDRLRDKWLTTFVRPYSFNEIIKNNIWIVLLFLLLVTLSAVSFTVSARRKRKNEEERFRNAQVIEQLAQDFGCVNYVLLTDKPETDIVMNYRVSEKLKALIPGWENEKYFRHKLELLRDAVVYEPDRQQFSEASSRERVMEELKHSDVYYVNTRIFFEDKLRYYQMKFSPVYEDGSIKAIVAGLHSVDEQTRKEMELQQQLEDALSMAQSANRAKTAFLNNMSHDIRTPMNAIIGFTDLARKNLDNRDKMQDYLEKIRQSSKHLLSLINDVLDMSHIESGKMNLEEKPENMAEIIRGIQDIVQAEMQTKGHSFSVEITDIGDKRVVCDRLKLNQVLLNILSNAIKYTPEGGKISLSAAETERSPSGYATYEFRVKDNGIGMDREFLKTVYDPFSRVKSSTVSGIQGTGLGMAITKNLVDMMGGRIDIDSEPGKGTEMKAVFRFKVAESREEVEEKEAAQLDFSGKKILLVEDNELNREIATEILTEEGFVIDTAEDGTVAVEKMKNAEAGCYDLILMDVQMPLMDGYEATRRIRAMNTEASKIPILAMTANAFEEDRRAALEAGMDEHIAKPIDVQKLFRTLAKFNLARGETESEG